jgi:cytochrome c2
MHRHFVSRTLPIAILLIVLVGLTIPALAGGWTVITLKELPDFAVVGEPLKIEFTALQHGKTPWVYDNVMIQAEQVESSARLTVKAEGNPAAPGSYTAELNFPQPGRWSWGIQGGMFPERQPMPDLEVVGQTLASPAGTRNVTLQLAAGIAGLAVAAAVGLVLRRKQPLLAAAILASGFVLSVVAFSQASVAARAASEKLKITAEMVTAPSHAELGRRLFQAKGCVVCHVNRNAETSPEISLEVGPDLTRVTKDARYLEAWLANPSAVKPDTTMPNLQLSQSEIEALIAFLDPPAPGE